jgi:hypothetical protein
VEGGDELENSGDLVFVSQVLRRSWDCGNCRDGDSCGWGMPTISSARTRLSRRGRLGNKLSPIALVDTCFAVSINLVFVVVVDVGTC